MNGCAAWNNQNSAKCIGVQWQPTVLGPAGESGGGQCSYLWEMISQYADNGVDSAYLNISSPSVSSIPFST